MDASVQRYYGCLFCNKYIELVGYSDMLKVYICEVKLWVLKKYNS